MGRRAAELARQVGVAEILRESLVIEGFMQSPRALRRLKPLVGPEGITAGGREEAAQHVALFVRGCKQAEEALLAWSKAVAPDVEPVEGERYWQVWEVLRRTAADMVALAAELGLRIETPGG